MDPQISDAGVEHHPPSSPFAPLPAPPVAAPPPPPRWHPFLPRSWMPQLLAWARERFLGKDPTFGAALGPFALLTAILFSRWPATNFIFDEQEALLANPYVNATGGLRYRDAIIRDFWGLPPDRSIGSYRPIPNLLWRAIWQLSSKSDGI